MVIPYVLIVASLAYGVMNPFFMLKYLSFIILFAGLMQSYYWMKERNTDFIYGVLYSLFWFTCLWWVVPLQHCNGRQRQLDDADATGGGGVGPWLAEGPRRLAA